MILRIMVLLGLSWACLHSLQAQGISAELNFYGDVMINAAEGEHRLRASQAFDKHFKSALDDGQIEELKQLKWVSHITPDDGSFDLFTWQVKESEEKHSHRGYVITQDQQIPLVDTEYEEIDYPYMELSNEDWSGLLYYEIKTININGENVHVLFGYDGSDQFNTIKVAESIVVEGNKVLFGSKPIFEFPNQGVRSDVRNRLFLKYSEFSNLTLGYNEGLEMILFDHLITRMGTVPGQGPTQISDGSYEAFAYQDGKLVYKEKVFDQISIQAPIPEPVLGKGRSETITGEQKEKGSKARK